MACPVDITDARADALTRLMPVLMARARRAARSGLDAEDLAQEALLRVWSRLEASENIDGIEAYLMVTMRHLARRRRRVPEPLEDAETAALDASAETRVFTAEVLAEVARLPREEAAMITAIALEGVSYRDYARRTGLPIGTIMSRLARSRQRLRDRLSADHGISEIAASRN